MTSSVAAVRQALDEAMHDALLFVDGVSSIGSIPFEMDAWGVDLAVTGSQKGLMCPAGLGILGVSDKARAARGMRRGFFAFEDFELQAAQGYFPHTPPTPVLHGLRAALDRMAAETLPAVYARLAAGVRAAVTAWGLETVCESPALASDTVTAIRTPVDAREVIRIGFQRYNASFGSGLGPLTGKAFRIGHLGDLNEGMCLAALALAEICLREAGVALTLGSGVAAAQAIYEHRAPMALAAE